MSQSGDADTDSITDISANFWNPKQYVKTVKRLENAHKLSQDLSQFILDRAELEKNYSLNLKKWSTKWASYVENSSEYGSNRTGWLSWCKEANEIADIHLEFRNKLSEIIPTDIKPWAKERFHKAALPTPHFKEVKNLESEFEMAQKPWVKRLKKVEVCKKEYHNFCIKEKTMNNQLQTAKIDSASNAEQIKKIEEKLKKVESEVERTKLSYEAALHDLEGDSTRYMEEMEKVFNRAQQLEQDRMQFFKSMFEKVRGVVNISEIQQLPSIFQTFNSNIQMMNYEADLKNWSINNGAAMVFQMPQFEDYKLEASNLSSKKKAQSNSPEIALKSVVQQNNHYNQSDKTSNSVSDTRPVPAPRDLSAYNESLNPFGNEESTPVPKQADCNYDTSVDNCYDTVIVDDNRPGVQVRALYDYSSQEDDELNLKAGLIFDKLEDEDEQGWCKGRINGIVGLYPANYAEIV